MLYINKFRRKLVEKFYESLSNHDSEDNNSFTDVCVFLDCVLDKNFKDLKIHTAFPDAKLCSKVIPTVVKWCPDLKKLSINCGLRNVSTCEEDWREKGESVIRPLSSLQHLTDLSLYDTTDWELLSMLPLIGKSCPFLSHLNVHGYELYVDILLVLILEEAFDHDALPVRHPSFWKNDQLECLVIPPERLSPISFTLVDFRLKSTDQACSINASAISFALRHLPLIQRMGKQMPVSLAIKILYYSPAFRAQEEMRNAFKEPAANQQIFFRNLGVNFTGT